MYICAKVTVFYHTYYITYIVSSSDISYSVTVRCVFVPYYATATQNPVEKGDVLMYKLLRVHATPFETMKKQ